MLHKEDIEILLQDIIGKKAVDAGLFGLAISYFNSLPRLIAGTFLSPVVNPTIYRGRLKNSSFKANTFFPIFKEFSENHWNEQQIRIILKDVIPAMIAIASLRRNDNTSHSFEYFIQCLLRQILEKKIRLFSPLCPPYTYIRTDNGVVQHGSGKLHATMGPRFGKVANTLKEIFLPLSQAGISISWEFWSYSGETHCVHDLVDIACFVKNHYQGRESMLFEALQTAYNEMNDVLERTFQDTDIRWQTRSIDKEFGPKINSLAREYTVTFPDQLKYISDWATVEKWLQKSGGSRELFSEFALEEQAYREALMKETLTFNDHPIPAAICENWIYIYLLNQANSTNSIIFDTETTTNYMLAALKEIPCPILFGNTGAKEPDNDQYTLNIRQPYNPVLTHRYRN